MARTSAASSKRKRPQPARRVAGRRKSGASRRARRDRQLKCLVCGVHTARLQNHMKQEHLPFYLFPETACWVCGLQLARQSTLRKHLKDHHHATDSCAFQQHLSAVWTLTINGFLFSLAGLFQLVSPEALRALAICLGVLPKEVPEKERATRELYATSCPSSPGAAPPAAIAELISAHALGGLCAQLPGSIKIRLQGLLTVP